MVLGAIACEEHGTWSRLRRWQLETYLPLLSLSVNHSLKCKQLVRVLPEWDLYVLRSDARSYQSVSPPRRRSNGERRMIVENRMSPELPADAEADGEFQSLTCHPGAMKTFEAAVSHGLYLKDAGGLEGKHDNVRRHWEDQVTRYALHDCMARLVERKRKALSRIRVLDLGAGAGEGYEILGSLRRAKHGLAGAEVDILPAEMLGRYKGIDVSEAMVNQGNEIYRDDPKVCFEMGDLSQGLLAVQDDDPYDIYFSSYGSLSHLNDMELAALVSDIADHAPDSFVFVADLIGRYSFEWQCYWGSSGEDETNMRQYSMSWLYPPELMHKIEVERFPVRYWGGREFVHFIEEALASNDCRIKEKRIWDRSILVGRHMNTCEFNPHAQPIRFAVNSLFQFNRRTDLYELIFDYVPHEGFNELNAFFEKMQVAWNALVYGSIEALEHSDDEEWLSSSPTDAYPDVVKGALRAMRNLVRNVQSFRMGDARANIIEPQLGYHLRNLEVEIGEGLGAGHGLLAIYEIEKG